MFHLTRNLAKLHLNGEKIDRSELRSILSYLTRNLAKLRLWRTP